jgi:hypothetical protein
VVSLAASGIAYLLSLTFWWLTAPGLWELTTMPVHRPVQPVPFGGVLAVGMLAGALAEFISMIALALTNRRLPMMAAVIGCVISCLPILNFVLFFAIIAVRGIELRS